MISIVISWAIGYFFVLLFLCGTDFAAYWTTSITEKDDCLPTGPVHLSYAITDVITDILTILLPIPEVLKDNCSRVDQMTDLILDMEASPADSAQGCDHVCVRAWCYVGLLGSVKMHAAD